MTAELEKRSVGVIGAGVIGLSWTTLFAPTGSACG
jgi:3-hydroxyacyl-CoA dehydrogenase